MIGSRSTLQRDRKQVYILDQLKRVVLDGIVPTLQLIENGVTGDQFETRPMLIPPLARPFPSSYHLGLRSNLVIKAWNGRLDVDFRT